MKNIKSIVFFCHGGRYAALDIEISLFIRHFAGSIHLLHNASFGEEVCFELRLLNLGPDGCWIKPASGKGPVAITLLHLFQGEINVNQLLGR